MAETDPLSDIFTLFAAPLANTLKSVEQFRKGVDEFLRGVENFNRTMENLNETAERINGMLTEVEEPLRIAVPQVTRTIQTADEVMAVMSGPAKAVAPGLTRLAEVLDNPAYTQVPSQLSQMNEMLSELTQRLAPLGQIAESAGGLFGGLRLPGLGQPARPTAGTTPRPDSKQAAATTATAKQATAKKPTAKKASAKKASAKKASAKKASAKTASAKKASAKTAAAKTASAKTASDTRAASTPAPAAEATDADD